VPRLKNLCAATALVLLTAGPAAAGSLTLTWTDNTKGTATTEIERRVGKESFKKIAEVAPGTSRYVDGPNLRLDLEYCYRTRSRSSNGLSPYSGESCGRPKP